MDALEKQQKRNCRVYTGVSCQWKAMVFIPQSL